MHSTDFAVCRPAYCVPALAVPLVTGRPVVAKEATAKAPTKAHFIVITPFLVAGLAHSNPEIDFVGRDSVPPADFESVIQAATSYA